MISTVVMTEWLNWGRRHRGWSEGTQTLYVARVKAADRWMRQQGWAGVTRGTEAQWLEWWGQLPDTASSKNLARNALLGFGEFLATTGRRASNPAQGIPSWRKRRGVPRPLPVEQSRQLLQQYRIADDKTAMLVTLLLTTGLRISEAASLEWADVAGGWVHVTGKGDKERRVPISPTLERALRRWRKKCPSPIYLFPGPNGAITAHSARQRVKRAAGFLPHSARHSFATAILEKTGDLRLVQELLGHASVATSQVYTFVAPRRAVEGVDNLYDEDDAA